VNGRRINHIRGSRKIITSANGQQSASRMNQRMIANKVFMGQLIFARHYKRLASLESLLFIINSGVFILTLFITEHFLDQKCTV
jgi:hypothetical protein